MSIRRGSREELGNIKYLGPCYESDDAFYTDADHKEDLLGVFWKDRLIWPTQSKYQFWVTNEYFVRQSISDDVLYIYDVEPCKTDITIYARSCTRFYDKKYDFEVTCSSTWISIDGNPSISDRKVVVNRVACSSTPSSSDVPDGQFTINVAMNTSPFSRTTTLVCSQIDDLQQDAPTGKQFTIVIVQKGDYPVKGSEDFSKTTTSWFDSEDFLHTVSSYGTKDKGIVPISGGTFKVYFMIDVSTKMKSGIWSSRFYGTVGNESSSISRSNFTTSDPNIAYVTDVEYNGNGGWIATCVCNPNDNKAGQPSFTISDLNATPNTVSYQGGSITVSWVVNASIVTNFKAISLILSIPEKIDPVGTVNCYEDGGSRTYKDVDVASHVVIPSNASSWISLDGTTTVASNGTRKQKLVVYNQKSTSKMYIENFSTSYSDDVIPCDATSVTFSFEIYRKDNTYLERVASLSVVAGSTSESINIKQTGKDGTNHIEVDDSMLASSALHAYIDNPTDDTYYGSFLSDFRNVRYYRYLWRIDATVSPNPQQTVDKGIYIVGYAKNISENSHDETVTWNVKSGVANSLVRHSILKISIPTYNTDHSEEITQSGSSSTEKIVYYDDLTCNIENVTDSLVGTVSTDKTTHLYTGKIHVNANNSRYDDNVAYVVPSKIEEHYNTIVDNNSLSAIYLKVIGHPSYKGTTRNVTYKISATDLTSKTVSVTQKENTVVVDDNTDVPSIGLNDDWFSVTADSEGSIYGRSTLVSEEVGLYMIPIHVLENDSPTNVDCHVDFNSHSYGSSSSVVLPSIYVKDTFPVSGWWRKYGAPVDRQVTLVVRDVASIKFVWKDVRYSGDMSIHNSVDEDYKITIDPNKEWYFMESSNTLSVDANNTGARRTAALTTEFYDGDDVLSNIKLDLIQDPNNTEGDYEFSSEYASMWTEISNSNVVEMTVSSYDKYDKKVMTLKEEYDDTKIVVYKSYSDSGLVTYKVRAKSNNTSASPAKVPIKISQYDRNGKLRNQTLTLNTYLASYSLDIDKKDVVMSLTSDKATLKVASKKKTIDNNGNVQEEDVRFATMMSSNDLIVMNVVDTNIILSCISQNKEIAEQSITLKVEQQNTNAISTAKIRVPSWRDSEYNYSDLHLYKKNDYRDVLFFSMENDTQLQPSVKMLTGSIPNMNNPEVISTSLSKYDDRWKITFKSNKDLDGEMSVYGYFEVYNKNIILGRSRVYLHAFTLSASTENKDGTYTWYLSARSGDLWSVYYVYSKQDGEDVDFTIEESNDDLSITRNGNAIEVIPIYDNDKSYRVEYSMKIKQANSDRTMTIKMLQLMESEMD